MVTTNEPLAIGRLSTRYMRLTRSCIIVFGCFAVWWGIIELPIVWRQSSVERIAKEIIAGEAFRNATLANQLPIIDSIQRSTYCRSTALRSAVIIQLRMFEMAARTNDRDHLDKDSTSLIEAIHSSLSCLPADPFMWLALYYVESTGKRDKSDYLQYLRMSYQLGPNEGWIASKRNRLLFAHFDQLPRDLVDNGISELIEMLKDRQFIADAADIFVGPAWQERDQIIPRLSELSQANREIFAGILRSKGFDITIPGT
jgi:hypothetical protein